MPYNIILGSYLMVGRVMEYISVAGPSQVKVAGSIKFERRNARFRQPYIWCSSIYSSVQLLYIVGGSRTRIEASPVIAKG
jgi:hypothetical protein